jgi:hypothetical protein
LNLILDTLMPQDGIETISHFLECPEMVSSASLKRSQAKMARVDVIGPFIDPLIASSQQILSCTVACENILTRLETLRSTAAQHPIVIERVTEDTSSSSKEAPDIAIASAMSTIPFLEPLLPFEISESLKGAMHEALMKIMTERDEAHAQLIAASVLHVHEMEQERKRVDRLNDQLKASTSALKAAELANVTGNFFADKSLVVEKTRESMKGKMTAMQEQTIQNAEQDMLNLCQQLAREISAKTSASLEIIRLRESRKIERENEQAEKLALQEELKRCKEQLASKERNAEEARQEACAWKEAYENLKGD